MLTLHVPPLRAAWIPCIGALLATSIACSRTGPTPGEAPVAPRTNVILVTMDTVRADHLGCFGYERPTTPNLDRFAEVSTRYGRAHTTAPWTLPAHASLFTGLYPPEHGAQMVKRTPELMRNQQKIRQALSLDRTFPTLAEVLRDSGYRTAAVVANFLYLSPDYGLERGFDHYDVLEGVVDVSAAPAGDVNRRVFDWLRSNGEEPFFLFINYMDAHTPYNTTPRPGFLDGTPKFTKELQQQLHFTILPEAHRPVPKGMLETYIDQYDLGLANVDAGIGALLSGLRDLGLYDDTLLIITSDHGEYLGEHSLIEHAKDVYEQAMWIPLFVKMPGQTDGVEEDRLISLVHLPHLILEATGVDLEEARNPFPYAWPTPAVLAQNNYSLWKDMMMVWGSRFDRIREVVYEGDFKFIHSSDGRHELYDLTDDPAEEDNLVQGITPRLKEWTDKMDALRPRQSYDATGRAPEKMTEEELRKGEALGYFESPPR